MEWGVGPSGHARLCTALRSGLIRIFGFDQCKNGNNGTSREINWSRRTSADVMLDRQEVLF